MSSLHIRDISNILMKRLKLEAAILGITLKEYVTDRLWNGGDTLREVEEEREAIGVSSPKEESAKDSRVPDVPRQAGVPKARGRKPAARKSVGCEHGISPGHFCLKCGRTVE